MTSVKLAIMAQNTQIYSATYSNVPVFEYVTAEGPIMRRKLDSWINATHILKIAKFPKAKRTRILEKDVQTGTHEKVQGGYGKYQGTYVPLELGAEIAKNFGVFDVLRPIFEFEYVEGKSETPPPAPKHSHASASNVARRQASASAHATANGEEYTGARRMRSMPSAEPPRKRGRPKRTIQKTLERSDTTPIVPSKGNAGPNVGTFNTKRGSRRPSVSRQDTEQDVLQVMASNMNVNQEDLDFVDKSSDDDENDEDKAIHDDHDELLSGKELFGTPRSSFERIMRSKVHNLDISNSNSHINGSMGDPYGLQQYHILTSMQPSPVIKDDPYSEYFNTLLNFFLEEGNNTREQMERGELSDEILNPPKPLSKINISQQIDNDGNTIFHWACSMGNIPIIKFLLTTFKGYLQCGIKNNSGETPLMFLVKFSNSYQLKNFPDILDLLNSSIFSTDYSEKTVLHHIALGANSVSAESSVNGSDFQTLRKNKERYAKFYLENLLEKLSDIQQHEGNTPNNEGHRWLLDDLLSRLLNHQDSDGNTAFHIFAYNLNKKCIRVIINYHKYINFQLKNLVGYTAEDYLASHNHVLRLDNSGDNNDIFKGESDGKLTANDIEILNSNPGLESQIHATKAMYHMSATSTNLISEKLARLAYCMDKDLAEQDQNLLQCFRLIKLANYEKLLSQKAVLLIFRLEYLIENVENEYYTTSSEDDYLVLDRKKDRIIQDEIIRLVNDLCYQVLHKKYDVDKASSEYRKLLEKSCAAFLTEQIKGNKGDDLLYSKEVEKPTVKVNDALNCLTEKPLNDLDNEEALCKALQPEEEQIVLAAALQSQILKKKALTQKLFEMHLKTPIFAEAAISTDGSSMPNGKDDPYRMKDDKENKENIKQESMSNALEAETDLKTSPAKSFVARYPHDTTLQKYCKLIALCCGMNFDEVESSIDFIEQSLSRSIPGK